MKYRETILDAVTFAAAIAAVIASVVVVSARTTGLPTQEDRAVEDWARYVAEGRRMGPDHALLTIVEFGDYECPACRRFESVLDSIRTTYPTEVSVVYRHWPLPQHRYAYVAARAAECAGNQGRFEPYHRLLYSTDQWLGDAFERFAAESGVSDLEEFKRCYESDEPVPAIESGIAGANAVQAIGTPTLIVNGTLLGTIPTFDDLERMLKEARRAGT